jgi:hypothetical protein
MIMPTVRRPAGDTESMIVAATVATTLGPMITAYSTELGKRLGGSTADWLKKVRLRPRRATAGKRGNTAVLQVKTDGGLTTFEVSDELSDDAKLALIEIDMANPEIRGQGLRWDGSQWRRADRPKTSPI